jgi:fucose permease
VGNQPLYHTASDGSQYHRRQLFVASCVSLIATAMCFAIRGDILGDLEKHFKLTHAQAGWAGGAWAWGFAGAILFGGPLCDVLGMRRLMILAFVSHAFGIVLTIVAPNFAVLFLSVLIVGIGNGLVEAAINPLVATIYPDAKTARLNLLHAWFPGGIVIGGLVGFGISKTGLSTFALGAITGYAWQVKMATILVPVVIYGILFIRQQLPPTERVAAGVSTGDMWKEGLRPLFLLLVFCMMLTASTELGPNTWVSEVTKKTIENMRDAGILVLVWISLIMCVGRFFAGPLAHAISPIGIVLCSAVVSGIGLLLLGSAGSALTAFGAAAVFALGVCFFWPTMLGITSERFPKGGALLLAVMGAAGNISVALASPAMGRIVDVTGSYHAALRYMAILPAILVVLFGAIFIRDLSRGGYQAVKLGGEQEPAEPTEAKSE